MPTAPIMQLPPTKSADEFEKMCRDVLQTMYNICFFQYGRQGQRQDGVDLFSERDCSGYYTVAQCKNYYGCTHKALINKIETDIRAACSWSENIKTFIVMTSLNRDASAQKLMMQIEAPFNIIILFWEDIAEQICSNVNLLERYYPSIFVQDLFSIEIRNKLISCANDICVSVIYFQNNYLQSICGKIYNIDCKMYNRCVEIINAVIELGKLQDKYFLQLEARKINLAINRLRCLVPSFYMENEGDCGANMITTITCAQKAYGNEDTVKEIVICCNTIIELCKN